MAKKKNKKSIAKKAAKSQQRKKQKRKLRLVKTKQQQRPAPHYFDQQPMAEIDTPPGYRAVSMSQAMMEYSKSIINFEDAGDIEDMNSMFQFTALLWNYAISVESGKVSDKMDQEILGMIKAIWQVEEEQAKELLNKFVAKKSELFPPEIQVPGSPTMFMKKQMAHLIAPFNYNKLNLTDEVFPPDGDDFDFLKKLSTIDKYIQVEKDYSSWEDEYFEMEKACKYSFAKWLTKKGVTGKYSQDFPFLTEIFMNFVYRYLHDDVITLKSVHPIYFEEFLFDHVLRKVMMEPHEHVDWVPALKLFYQFLYEKGHIDDAGMFVGIIDGLERQFIDVLQERYS